MTQVREHKQTLMPYNPHMLNMNVQDVVDEILGAESDEEQVHKATQEYIRQTSYEERIKLGIMVSERVVQHRHLIEANNRADNRRCPQRPRCHDGERGQPPGNQTDQALNRTSTKLGSTGTS